MSEFGRRRSLHFAPWKGRPRSFVRQPRRFRRARRPRRPRARNPGLGVELKFYDTTLADSNIATTTDGSGIEEDPSATIVLNSVVQGDGESNRDGRKIIMKSIYVSGLISFGPQNDQTAGEVAPDVAIWLVLDKQTNGATIASENVFVNKSADILGSTSIMRNLQFTSRFRILDKVSFTMQSPPQSGDSTNFDVQGAVVKWSLSSNLKNMPVLYSGTTETVANITTNSLHILATCSSVTFSPTITYNSRLRFVG